jgi:hypothetical protein
MFVYQETPHAGPQVVHGICRKSKLKRSSARFIRPEQVKARHHSSFTHWREERRKASKFQLCTYELLHPAAAAYPLPQYLFQSLPNTLCVLESGHHFNIYPP